MADSGVIGRREPDHKPATIERGRNIAQRFREVDFQLDDINSRRAIEPDHDLTAGLADIIDHRSGPIENDASELRTRRMTLIARVIAAENGAMGQSIRLRNARSKRIVEGIVVGPGRVVVPHADSSIPGS